jgi:hypothetical protein
MCWGQLSAEDYRAGAGSVRSAGQREDWVRLNADRIESLGLPTLRVYLGRQLSVRNAGALRSARAKVEDAAGLGPAGVSLSEESSAEAAHQVIANKLQRSRLAGSGSASAAEVAWLISWELDRESAWTPTTGRIEGAAVSRLLHAKVRPRADHVELIGKTSRVFVATLVCAEFADLELPGGEWLDRLSEIPDVRADFSGRLEFETTRDGVKRWRETEKSAKEQIRTAEAGSAGAAPEEVYDTLETARGMVRGLRRDGMSMLVSDPRWVVSASSPQELDERVEIVEQFYGGLGLELWRPPYVQKQLWLEQLPGDQRRVPEFYQYQPAITLAGSWFYGGMELGDADGPYVGTLTGTHAGIVRMNLLASANRGDATTALFLGKSGSGKTTAMMMCCLNAALDDAWVAFVDFKGDCAGLVDVARDWGVPAELVRLNAEFPGVLDAYGFMPAHEAKTESVAQLLGMLPASQRAAAEGFVLAAAERVSATPEPSNAATVADLIGQGGAAGELGMRLADLASQDLGRPIAGERRSDQTPLDSSRGLRVLQFPGLTLPKVGVPESEWTLPQRLSMVVFRGAIAYTTYVANRLRDMAKLVALPELHLITSTSDGVAFVDAVARTGRALKTNLLLDSQVAVDVLRMDGVREQATFVCAFEATSVSEQNAILEILNVEPSPEWRERLGALAPMRVGDDGIARKVKGHAVLRDREGNVGEMQWDVLTTAIRDGLSTTPPEDQVRYDADGNHSVDDDGGQEEGTSWPANWDFESSPR